MSIEFDIAVLRAPHEPKDEIDMIQLISRARAAADAIEILLNKTKKQEGLVLRLYTVIDDIVGHLEERSGFDCELQIHLLDYLRAIEIKKEIESLGILK
jgi:hypothetical protein